LTAKICITRKNFVDPKHLQNSGRKSAQILWQTLRWFADAQENLHILKHLQNLGEKICTAQKNQCETKEMIDVLQSERVYWNSRCPLVQIVMSLLMMIKEFVWGRKLSEASLPEDTEVAKLQIYHDEWADKIKQPYAKDLRSLLAMVDEYRHVRLQEVRAVVKRRALKFQHKKEREADPYKMKKYLAKSEASARCYRAKKLYMKCKRRGSFEGVVTT
jgi:hypothetical protein